MSDQIISQEEIDALLRGDAGMDDMSSADSGSSDTTGGDSPPPSGGAGGGSGVFDDILTPGQKKNLLNFSKNYIASNLNVIETILGINVKLLSEKLEFLEVNQLLEGKSYWGSIVEFTDGIWGKIFLVLDKELAVSISKLILGGEADDEDKLREMGFLEISTHIFGASLPELQNFFKVLVQGNIVGSFSTQSPDNPLVETSPFYAAIFDVNIENVGTGAFCILYPWVFINDNKSFFDDEKSQLEDKLAEEMGTLDEQIDEAELEKVLGELSGKENISTPTGSPGISEPQLSVQGPSVQEKQTTAEVSTAIPQQQPSISQEPPSQMMQQSIPASSQPKNKFANATIQGVEFAEITPSGNVQTMPKNIELLLDVPLKVTVELGRTRKKIREILELGVGSVIELEKQAGESVDLLVNDNLIAKGEVVVIDENFGIRITSIVSPQERLERLK